MARTIVGALGMWLGVAAPVQALAQDLTLDVDPDKASLLGIDVASMEKELETQAGEALNLADPQTFVDSMANAGAIASKGMGVDYASNMKAFVIGGGFGSSVHSSGFRFSRSGDPLPPGGFAFMISVMAGVNLGVLDGGADTFLDRIRIYANGMSVQVPNDREFGGSMYNVGVHGQLKIVPEAGNKLTEWGGLDLTAGWERSQYALQLTRALPITAPLDGPEITWTADGVYDITATTDSIPLEVSTNMRVAIVTVFAGGGVDINTSTSTSAASLSGPLDATYQGQSERLGTATLTVGYDGVGDAIVPRAFGGVQVGLSLLKIYGHLNAGLNGTVGGHLGARVAL
jgi:hypothetical protein